MLRLAKFDASDSFNRVKELCVFLLSKVMAILSLRTVVRQICNF